MKIRLWLIKVLAGGRPVAMNLRLIRGLFIDGENSSWGFYSNIKIRHVEDKRIDESCGVYLWVGDQDA